MSQFGKMAGILVAVMLVSTSARANDGEIRKMRNGIDKDKRPAQNFNARLKDSEGKLREVNIGISRVDSIEDDYVQGKLQILSFHNDGDRTQEEVTFHIEKMSNGKSKLYFMNAKGEIYAANTDEVAQQLEKTMETNAAIARRTREALDQFRAEKCPVPEQRTACYQTIESIPQLQSLVTEHESAMLKSRQDFQRLLRESQKTLQFVMPEESIRQSEFQKLQRLIQRSKTGENPYRMPRPYHLDNDEGIAIQSPEDAARDRRRRENERRRSQKGDTAPVGTSQPAQGTQGTQGSHQGQGR